MGHKLTLISAPAGFGKTTLVRDWVHTIHEATQPISTAWLSLDEGDNDQARFLAYLIAALNQSRDAETTLGKGSLILLQSSQTLPTEAILAPLINELATLPHTIVLVLDDYHLIEAQPIHDVLGFFIENGPPQLHFVIATREDPLLPLSRFRARAQLTELRAADLRFTSAEAAEFLNQVMDLSLAAEDIAALEARTEGWITGLQLAALSLQGSNEPSEFVRSFTGSHRYVLDYLMEEVLGQQPKIVQEFLLQTAVLDRLTGSLCDALRFGNTQTPTGQHSSQEILEKLDHTNLFIIPLDENRHWYRYHHLFSDLLRRRLRQIQPDQIVALHHRASQWHTQNGFIVEAIEHAIRANDLKWAAHLIDENVDSLWGRGKSSKLPRWLDTMPEEILVSRPKIKIFQARYQCNSGRLDEAESTLNLVEQVVMSDTSPTLESGLQTHILLTDPERVSLRGRVAATRALLCSYRGDISGIIHQAQLALDNLPQEDLTWRGVAALVLGNAYGFKGDMRAAYAARFEALKVCEAAGEIFLVLLANLELAITLREQGRLQQTIEICQRQLHYADENGLSHTRTAGWLLAVWGETLAEQNDLSKAFDLASQGFELTRRSDDRQMLGWSFMCLIRTLISSGDLTGAEEVFQTMAHMAQTVRMPPWIENQITGWQVRLWLAKGHLAPASEWLAARGLVSDNQITPTEEIDFFLLFDYLVAARVFKAQGHLDETIQLLGRLHDTAVAKDRISKVIEILILQALTFQALAENERALLSLEQALTLAEPEGFMRIFIDEGQPMVRLLQEALKHDVAPDYARRLLAALSSDNPLPFSEPPVQVNQTDLAEPLSERELEILQKIAEGLTNREIADRLYLSLNTVKVHTRNIYGKLGVHNRTQAVARARNLGLLQIF